MCCVCLDIDCGLVLTLIGLFFDMIGVTVLFFKFTDKPKSLWRQDIELKIAEKSMKEIRGTDRVILVSSITESINEREDELHEEVLKLRKESYKWLGLIVLGFLLQFIGAYLSA